MIFFDFIFKLTWYNTMLHLLQSTFYRQKLFQTLILPAKGVIFNLYSIKTVFYN